jgi:hypothetical protein
MFSLDIILIVLGVVLAIVVALHAYARWSIRNIDRTEMTTPEDTSLKRSDLRA